MGVGLGGIRGLGRGGEMHEVSLTVSSDAVGVRHILRTLAAPAE